MAGEIDSCPWAYLEVSLLYWESCYCQSQRKASSERFLCKFTVIKMEKVEKESKQSGISSKMGGVNRSTHVSLAASSSTQRDLTMIPEIEDENRISTLEPPA